MDDPTFVPDIHTSGRLGYYAGHVYSDALVEATNHPPQHADLITVVPVDADVPMWQGDLRSGRISSAPSLCPATPCRRAQGIPLLCRGVRCRCWAVVSKAPTNRAD